MKEYNYTQWSNDLTKDIRFGDHRDDMDWNDGSFPEVDTWSIHVQHPVTGVGQTQSECNIDNLLKYFNSIKNDCKCIVEIGVDCNGSPTDMTSTKKLLLEKHPDTVYIGVDIEDKSYLNDEINNIFTIKIDSSNIDGVMEFVRSKNIESIDFLFIDGWHSINQVLKEWEYTKWLSPNGIVGFHDTAVHPGPAMFLKYLDRNIWNVDLPCQHMRNDFGIGFTWKK